MSVAKLCEEMGKNKEQGLRSGNIGIQEPQPNVQIVVYTTLANGTEELTYPSGAVKKVDGVEVHYFKRLTKDHSHFSPALYWKLWKTVKQFDIVHIHAWWNLVSMISCFIALFRGIKVVMTPRGTLSNYSFYNRSSKIKRLFHQIIGSRLLNKCHFHLTSEKEAQDTALLLKPRSLTVIPNFVEFPLDKAGFFKQKSSLTADPFRFVFLSRIEQKKGLELLFEVLATLSFSWKLRIAGTGDENYINTLKQLAISLGIQQHISWLGMLDKEKKFEELHNNDLFILPSFDENFANVVIESLFSATPVLITKNVGLSDYIEQKNLGWISNRNPQELKKTIETAKKEIISGTYNTSYLVDTIVEDYKEENIVSKYNQMYKLVINAS